MAGSNFVSDTGKEPSIGELHHWKREGKLIYWVCLEIHAAPVRQKE
jgi:hypothetical protein